MFITLTRSSDGLRWHVAVSHIISYSQRYAGEDTVVQTIDADQIVKDRPEEITALVDAEIRKQRRHEISLRLMTVDCSTGEEPLSVDHWVRQADALLDALEGGAK